VDVEIVAIGNELLLGETVDSNSAHIGRRLADIGARLRRITVVGDDPPRLAAALREVRGRSRWVITMGGLGPTRDDLTREVVAEVLGRPLRVDPDQLAIVEEKFRRFGYAEMPAYNRSQAEVPEGARVIPNPHGTAPALVLDEDGFTLFVLPGVPAEMKALFEEAVLPELARAAGDGALVVRSRVVHTVGIGESALAERVDDLVAAAAPVEVAFLPHTGQVDLRLTVAGVPAAEADRLLERVARAMTERAGPWAWGVDGTTLAGALGTELQRRGWSLAVAESCTAGGLAAEITSEPGSSAWFVGGVVAYADRIKVSLLGVPAETVACYGAVSEETCRAMARGARERLEADVGCAVTGIAGPGGGTPEKPVGLVWLGVETPDGARTRKLAAPGSREAVRRRSALWALGMLLRAARGEPEP